LITLRKADIDDSDSLESRCTVNKNFWNVTRVPHDHCACCCLRRTSVQWHGNVKIVFGWQEYIY